LLALVVGPASAADGGAHVRVLHGSPDAPEVDVYVNDAKVDALSGLAFGDLTAYVPVPAGTYAIKVCATADATVCPIDVPSLALADGQRYTIASTNVLASIEAQVLEDDPAPTTEGTQARVVHFSADTPAIDVLTQDGATTVVSNLAYPDATDYLDLPAGSYDLKVCANADTSVCPLDPGPLDLQAGRSYSVFAIGSLEGGTLTAAVGVDAVAPPATDTLTEPAAADASLSTSMTAAAIGLAFLVSLVGALRWAEVRRRS
jgi:hypothetical protein